MHWARQVHNLQLDISSHCNAACGACVRNKDGGITEPQLSLDNFDVALWKRLASEDTRGWYVTKLTLNGNWGDPMMHPDLIEMLEIWNYHHPESSLFIATNGSMRSKQFWLDLARVSRQFPNSKVDFAVDGLADTHHLYRRKTIFSKLIENIKHFTSAQGNACMMMTVFKHNQHQIEDVRALAEETKCRTFVARRSHSDDMHIKTDTEDYTMYAGDTKQYKQQTRFDQGWNNSDIRDASVYGQINEQFDTLYEFAEDSKCPWYKDQEIQIDPWGVVWPCCHISLLGVDLDKHTLTDSADNSIIEARKSNNLHNYSLTEVLYNEWFSTTVPNAVENASWQICRNNCGVCK